MSLQDVDDLNGAVKKAARVLRHGGRFCVAILHLFSTAREFVDDSFERALIVKEPYQRQRRFVDAVERDGLAMVFHSMHRPLDAYTRALTDAGFVIDALVESVPDADYIRDQPRLQRQARIPWYLHLRATRR